MKNIIEKVIIMDFGKKSYDKFRNQCHLTGVYRGPAHRKFNKNITKKQSSFYSFCISQFQ